MTAPETPVRVTLVTQPMGLWASLNAARRNVLSIIPQIATRQPMVSGRTGKRWHMVMDPGAIREILLERLDNYPKSLVTKNLLKPAIGESLFIAEGAHWRWQRRAAAPVFSHRNVMNLAPIMSGAAERSCERIADAQSREHTVAQILVGAQCLVQRGRIRFHRRKRVDDRWQDLVLHLDCAQSALGERFGRGGHRGERLADVA